MSGLNRRGAWLRPSAPTRVMAPIVSNEGMRTDESPMGRRATGDGRRATSDERRATSDERKLPALCTDPIASSPHRPHENAHVTRISGGAMAGRILLIRHGR